MTAPDSTCYSPSLFVDSVPLNFTPGGGDQSVTVPLNSAALAWPNSSVSVGPVTGVDSGSVSCSIVDGSLLCNYTDGQGCPPPFTGGQCPCVLYSYTISYSGVDHPAVPTTPQTATARGPVNIEKRRVSGFSQVWVSGSNANCSALVENRILNVPDQDNLLNFTVSIVRVDGQPDNCGDPPGECGDSGAGAVPVTYTGCFPQEQPPSDPPTEPAVTPLEPSTSPPSAPSSGGREGGGGGGLPGFGPGRRVSGQHVWERTVASNNLPVNADIPWYPVYGSSPNDSPDFRFFLPPLFGFRYGASPSLLPWNGIAVYADPHGGNLEVGNSYRSNYMTPRINMSSLTRLKRTYGVSIVANGFTEIVTPLDSTDTSEWGDVRYRALINTTLTEPHRTSETNYDGFRSEAGTTSYVIRETLKDVDAALQAMWWSSDEGVWSVEGFQVHTGNKGERNNRIFGGF